MKNEALLTESLSRVGSLSAELIGKAKDEEAALAVAVALVISATKIYEEIGGKSHAAAQFYAVADRLCGQISDGNTK